MRKVKESGVEGVAFQVTKEARSAGIIEETDDGETTRRGPVRVCAFHNLLLVVDLERVSDGDRAELVALAASDTESCGQAIDATVMHSGNGYAVQLPPADDAGFELGDPAATHTAPGVVLLSKKDGAGSREAARVARRLKEKRESQVGL